MSRPRRAAASLALAGGWLAAASAQQTAQEPERPATPPQPEGEAAELAERARAELGPLTDRRRQPVEPVVTEIGPHRYRIGEWIEIDAEARTATIPATVCFDGRTTQSGATATTTAEGQVIIEYALARAENGPVHEALLTTDAHAYDLQIALLLLSYQHDDAILAAQTVDPRGNPVAVDPLERALSPDSQPETRPEARVALSIRWQQDGAEREVPLSEALLDRDSGRAGSNRRFVFTGSAQVENFLAAESSGTLISTFLVRSALINPDDPRFTEDERWVPNPGVLPPVGTGVSLVVSPFVEEAAQ